MSEFLPSGEAPKRRLEQPQELGTPAVAAMVEFAPAAQVMGDVTEITLGAIPNSGDFGKEYQN